MQTLFEVQGHRGARGLKPENTLVSFEAALDLGVSAIETDLHLSADGVPVVYHDPQLSPRLCSLRSGSTAPDPAALPLVRSLTRDQLRAYRVDRNPAPHLFPRQDAEVTPLAQVFAHDAGLDPLGIPTLAEFFAFVAAYAGSLGERVGKSDDQRRRAAIRLFDLELKRVPFHPETIGDEAMEQCVIDAVRAAGVVERTFVRSFDHRSVRRVRALEPALRTAILIAHTAPVDPVSLAVAAGAERYCPDVHFTDAGLVAQVQAAGLRVIPWTVNEPAEWERLLAWGVAGVTTDVPDRLLAWLSERGVGVL